MLEEKKRKVEEIEEKGVCKDRKEEDREGRRKRNAGREEKEGGGDRREGSV
jgi:hypothetical protein